MRRHIPNTLTLMRVLLSFLLLLVSPFSYPFLIIYILCGFTDIADGYLARRWNLASNVGAILDSVADIIFLSVTLISIIRSITVNHSVVVWILIIACIKGLSLLVGLLRYGTFISLHTYINKFTGFIIFSYPFLYHYINANILAYGNCFVASVSAIEELVINCISKEVNRDIKGLFFRKGR
jgi:CDP-diacylglycerol--glycerol-3-phosphate 3-phosphatidyltransferase